ncbi:mce related family protein, partial [Vibrio parahaemolyticus V-223/04]
LSRFA